LWIVRGEEALSRLDPGGIEIEASTLGQFTAALLREGHTLKRALTDPRAFAGIGHTYSDEILHRARLSPLRRNMSLDEAEIERLWLAARSVLEEWCTICQAESKGGMPKEVRSGHEAMAVHGRFGQPCPVCGAPVQRIVYAERETNYCPGCQTGGRILADRALSRLLKDEFPRSLEDLDR
jgi:formamidopyrimidine-DNA glycosylase